jgi:hypothetical protein
MADDGTMQDLTLAQYIVATRDRPLGLALAGPDGGRDDVLLPQRVIGKETICGGFVGSLQGRLTSVVSFGLQHRQL